LTPGFTGEHPVSITAIAVAPPSLHFTRSLFSHLPPRLASHSQSLPLSIIFALSFPCSWNSTVTVVHPLSCNRKMNFKHLHLQTAYCLHSVCSVCGCWSLLRLYRLHSCTPPRGLLF
jgi:hypothetical protein